MRVLHLGKFYPPQPGGIERFTADLVRAQRAQGIEARVLAHAGRAGPAVDDGVELVPCHGQLLFVPVSPAWPLHFARALTRWRPQLLHVHLPNPSAFWLLLSRRARRLPWLLHWHADVPLDSEHRGLRLAYPAYRLFENALLAGASRIIATSAAYRDASLPLRAHLPRTAVVPLGLSDAPPAGIAPAWPQPSGLRLLAVGRLSYYKGFDTLVDALARVDDASLLLFGDGELRGALQQRIDALGLGARARLIAGADDGTIEAAYRACDVLCLPSVDRSEAFGLVLAEAMRAGRPVLASRIAGSGVTEVVRDGESGELLPVRDVAAWADAIARLRDDPRRRARYGAAARARFDAELRIEPVAERLTTLYRELLDAPAPR